jgi:hypothetical protein
MTGTEDGSEVEVIWSWLGEASKAKLVTRLLGRHHRGWQARDATRIRNLNHKELEGHKEIGIHEKEQSFSGIPPPTKRGQ